MQVEAQTIGERMLLLLHRHGWTLGDLSEATGIPIGTLSKYVNDVTRPPLPRLVAITRAFGITPNDLLGFKLNDSSDKASPGELDLAGWGMLKQPPDVGLPLPLEAAIA